MLKADIYYHNLNFIKPGGTSRGILKTKPTWFIKVFDQINKTKFGLGECGPIQGLSLESIDQMIDKLNEVKKNINELSNID